MKGCRRCRGVLWAGFQGDFLVVVCRQCRARIVRRAGPPGMTRLWQERFLHARRVALYLPKEGETMRVHAAVLVAAYSEQVSKKDGKIYRRAHLFIQGEDPGALECAIAPEATDLVAQVRQRVTTICQAVLNLRDYKGTLYVDLISLEPLPAAGA